MNEMIPWFKEPKVLFYFEWIMRMWWLYWMTMWRYFRNIYLSLLINSSCIFSDYFIGLLLNFRYFFLFFYLLNSYFCYIFYAWSRWIFLLLRSIFNRLLFLISFLIITICLWRRSLFFWYYIFLLLFY